MTVAELVQKLLTFDQQLEVGFDDSSWGTAQEVNFYIETMEQSTDGKGFHLTHFNFQDCVRKSVLVLAPRID